MVSPIRNLYTECNVLVSLPSSVKSLLILSPGSPSGILTSSLVEPSSDMRERKPSSVMSSCRPLATAFTYNHIAGPSSHQLEFAARHVGHVHVVGRRGQVFHLLAGEDVDGDHVNLGVTVLARLGGGHFHNLARTALDDHVSVLPQRRTLHGEGGRGASVGALEGVLMLRRGECQRLYIDEHFAHASSIVSCALDPAVAARRGSLTCASSAMLMNEWCARKTKQEEEDGLDVLSDSGMYLVEIAKEKKEWPLRAERVGQLCVAR